MSDEKNERKSSQALREKQKRNSVEKLRWFPGSSGLNHKGFNHKKRKKRKFEGKKKAILSEMEKKSISRFEGVQKERIISKMSCF